MKPGSALFTALVFVNVAYGSGSTMFRLQPSDPEVGDKRVRLQQISPEDAEELGLQPAADTRNNWEKHGEESWRKDFVPKDEHKANVFEKKTHGHHLFATLLICLIVTFSATFSMANSANKVLANCAWGILDSVFVVILAKSVFYIAQHYFNELEEEFPAWHVACHIIYALCLFFLALYGSYLLRPIAPETVSKNQQVFNAVIFWMVLLSKGGAIVSSQKTIGRSLYDVFLVTVASLLSLFALMFVAHWLKPEANYYDDVEHSLAGGAFAGGFVTLISMLIAGHDHDSKGGPWQDHEKTFWHAVVAVLSCVAAVIVTPKMGEIAKTAADGGHYWASRFLSCLTGFFGILPYFTVSLGIGGAVCNRLSIPPDAQMAKLVHAMMGTLVGCLMVFVCATIPRLKRNINDALPQLILGFGGFICGAGWADLVIGSTEEMVEGRSLEDETRSQAKIWIIVVVYIFCVLPMYVFYFKPAAIAKADALAAEQAAEALAAADKGKN